LSQNLLLIIDCEENQIPKPANYADTFAPVG